MYQLGNEILIVDCLKFKEVGDGNDSKPNYKITIVAKIIIMNNNNNVHLQMICKTYKYIGIIIM